MKALIRQYPLISYSTLAMVITGVLTLPNVVVGSSSEADHALGALGPMSAALIVIYILGRERGLLSYFQCLFDYRAARWLWFVAFSPMILGILLVTILPWFGVEQTQPLNTVPGAVWLSVILVALAYGLGEEAGWRGFALPRLQAHMNALEATIVLTIVHAIWHTPFFFYRFDFDLITSVGFFLSLFAGAILFTWMINQSGGKPLLTIVWHTTWNITSIIALSILPEVTYILSILLIVVAVLIVLLGKPENLATKTRWMEGQRKLNLFARGRV